MYITILPFDFQQKPFTKKEQEEIEELLKIIDERAFQNVVLEVSKRIDCTTCARCCKTLVPGFSDEDIDRIAKHLSLSRKEFIQYYLRKRDKKEYEMRQVPCLFLKDNKCSLYDVRPTVCKSYPKLSTKSNSYEVVSNTRICPIVFNVICNVTNSSMLNNYPHSHM